MPGIGSPGTASAFTDGDRVGAAELLGPEGLGLWDPATQEPADAGAAELITALSRAANPDLALRQLHRLVEAERRVEPDAPNSALLAGLTADPGLRHRLLAVLGASSALGDHLVANPEQWRTLATGPDGLAPNADGVLRLEQPGPAGVPTGPVVAELRRAYRITLLRIAAADLTGERDLEQTMAALSALADATLNAAYEIAVGELPAGTPRPRVAVVAMGKCGGGELNYVSDVDVIFVAATDADLAAATRVATRLIHVCGLVAWPVDAALRPEGSRGPLVRTLASHLAYYRRWARTWEFQALLKARPAAGDLDLAAEWIDGLAPLVWQAAERPEAVEDVRAMRRKIIDNVPPGELEREIKRGPGGLRDIEFAVQLLQLVHGRVDESLREPGTIPALRALVAGGYVGRADGEALLRGYRFLRAVEHRLQLQGLRRTHTVPTEPGALRWLAHALGYTATAERNAVEAFRADWVTHATEVRRLHAKLLYRPLLEAVARVPADGLRLTTDGGPAAVGDPRLRRPGRRAAPSAGAHRRGDPDRRDPTHPAAGAVAGVRRRAGAGPGTAQLPAGFRHAGPYPVVSAAAARRGAGGPATGPYPRPLPLRRRSAGPRPGGAAAARRRCRVDPARCRGAPRRPCRRRRPAPRRPWPTTPGRLG